MTLLLLALLAGCGAECDRGDMLSSEEGLFVTADEHPDGWGRADCEECHARDALHRTACTEGVDLGRLRARVEEEGYDGCASCHGSNGLEEDSGG